MFFANYVLAKKGPLARVWLAAHWEKKLSKAHVFETDIESSINSIMSPTVKIALRTSGHLLLGVVRIHSRKAKYLLADCSEAIVKIKMAFRPDVVDLPLDNQKASVAAITLPEVPEWDVMMSDLGPYDVATSLNKNQCRVEEITMKEDLISSRFLTDDSYFGDTQFGDVSDREVMREEASMNENLNINDVSNHLNDSTLKDRSVSRNDIDFQPMNDIDDAGFGAGEGLDFLEGFGNDVSEITGLEDIKLQDNDDLDQTKVPEEEGKEQHVEEDMEIDGKPETEQEKRDQEVVEEISAIMADNIPEHPVEPDVAMETVAEPPTEMTSSKTTLFSRDSEAFALEPMDDTVGKEKRKKRKRKLIVDDEKIISSDDLRKQIANPEDIVKAAVVAPPTKARMTHFDMNLKRLFTESCIPSRKLESRQIFLSNLTRTIPKDLEIPSSQNDEEEIELEKQPEPTIEDIQLPRDELQEDLLPDLTTEIQPVDEKTKEDDILDEFKENDMPPVQDDIEAHFALEKDENEITIPPPFELEKSVNISKTGIEDDSQEPEIDAIDSKKWTKRTHQTYCTLEKQWKKNDEVLFKDITKKCNRKQAALKFYSLLILSKTKAINFRQDTPFGDIILTVGDMRPILKSPVKSPMKSPIKSPQK